MKKLHYLGAVCLFTLLSSCNATRLITPIEKDSWQVGLSAGGPMIGSPLPLSSVSAAYGWKENTSLMGGLQLTSLMYNTIQFDLGAHRLLRQPEGWIPGVSANGILNSVIATRNKAFTLFPEISANAYYELGEKFKPYGGLQLWLDPYFENRFVSEGSLLHPTLLLGIQGEFNRVQLALETKWLNMDKQLFIPQVSHQTYGSTGAMGFYFRVSYSIRKN